jgi:signal transduction histidine kinase
MKAHAPAEPAVPATPLDEARRVEAAVEAAAAFAHDLKNPLSALLLGVQRLARLADPAHLAHARELAARLERSVVAMNRLIEAQADLTRLQAGQLPLLRQRAPCSGILAQAIEAHRAVATERKVDLVVELAADLPEVNWDAERVVQAVDHVLGSALRLAPEGAQAQCIVACAPGEVALTIAVERPAAPHPPPHPAAVPSATAARRIRGAGLLVARALVEAHGGRLEVEDGPNRTAVRIVLPAQPPHEP